MKPLIYGYMRVAAEADDESILQTEIALKDFAEAEGFCYATTFYEYNSGSHAAFTELVRELQRAEAHDVVLPSLDHLSRNSVLRFSMLIQLESQANARTHCAAKCPQ